MRHALIAMLLAACTSDAGGHLGQADGVTGLDVVDTFDGNALGCGPVGYSPGPRLMAVHADSGAMWLLEFEIDHATGETTIMGSLLASAEGGYRPADYERNVATAWRGCSHVDDLGAIVVDAGDADMVLKDENPPTIGTVSLAGTITQSDDEPARWTFVGKATGSSDAWNVSGSSITDAGFPESVPRVCSNAPCNFVATCLVHNYVRQHSCLD